MQKEYLAALGVAVMIATPAIAVSPFNGTWKIDLSTQQLSPKPDVFLLKDGVFTCSSCKPAVSMKADGKSHAIPGHDYSDAAKIEIVDAHTIKRTFTLHGKVTGTGTTTVSPDGKTLEYTFTSINPVTGVATTGKGIETRIAAAPAGAHLISGSWLAKAIQQLSDSGRLMTLKIVGDELTTSSPDGSGYKAKFGGPAVLQKADVGHTMISVAHPAPNKIIETDSRDGKVVGVYTMTLSTDGKSLALINDDKKAGEISKFTAIKQ